MEKKSNSSNKKQIWRSFFQNREPNVPLKKITMLKFGGIAVVLGILLIWFAPERSQSQKVQSVASMQEKVVEAGNEVHAESTIRGQEKIYEEQLQHLLEQMAGVSEVTVAVNLSATPKIIYEKNTTAQNQQTTEEDKQGGKRKIEQQNTSDQLVIVREGNNEVPVIQNELKADITGVAIVAKGAGQIAVKKQIVEAVTRFLGVPSHRVSVQPKK